MTHFFNKNCRGSKQFISIGNITCIDNVSCVNFLSMRNIIIFIFLNTVFNQNNFNH